MANIDSRIEAAYCERDGDAFVCGLCPHHCRIGEGQTGRCMARRAEGGKLFASSYGKVTSMCVDPMEKKPLYNYMPGKRCLSIGGAGCNMRCLHCQNFAISSIPTGRRRSTYVSPEDLVAHCRREGLGVIAFTYNEPMIWYEYIRDVAAVDPDIRIVLVTNGLACEGPLRDLCRIADAMNIDVKGFTEEFYMRECGAHLRDVLDSVRIVFSEGVHLELTYLVIPGRNDSEDEVRAFCSWVASELSSDVPVHFTRFHPDYKLTDVPWTPVETVLRCREIGIEEGLNYVYVGNIIAEGPGDTFCPRCGRPVIRRFGFSVDASELDGPRCSNCGFDLGIVRRRGPRGSAPGRVPGTSARRTAQRVLRGPSVSQLLSVRG